LCLRRDDQSILDIPQFPWNQPFRYATVPVFNLQTTFSLKRTDIVERNRYRVSYGDANYRI